MGQSSGVTRRMFQGHICCGYAFNFSSTLWENVSCDIT